VGSLCVHARCAVAALAVAACATTGATFRSGVGDTWLEHDERVAGAEARGVAPIGHLPVVYQRSTSQPSFEPATAPDTPIAALLREMNAELDALGASVRVVAAEVPPGTPPDVSFGCEQDASGECEARDPSKALGREGTALKLALGRPSEDWIAWTRRAAADARVAGVLVLTLEIGQYFTRQVGWKGNKEVELGKGHVVPLPWLTSLETPVPVLQLTGALISPDGKGIRIAAEGLLPKRTRLSLSAIGAQELITDQDVEQLRAARREDLPGRPLVWQVALRNLVAELTGNARD